MGARGGLRKGAGKQRTGIARLRAHAQRTRGGAAGAAAEAPPSPAAAGAGAPSGATAAAAAAAEAPPPPPPLPPPEEAPGGARPGLAGRRTLFSSSMRGAGGTPVNSVGEGSFPASQVMSVRGRLCGAGSVMGRVAAAAAEADELAM